MHVTEAAAKSFGEMVRQAKCVLIGSHLTPDGDALGSSLAVSHYLNGIGVDNEVLNHHAPPKNLEFLPGVQSVRQEPKHKDHDLAIVLDLDSLDRLGKCEPYFTDINRMIVVDHHIPHEAPGDLRLVDTSASATCAILTDLFLKLGANITADMATCLLAGIVTDTGSFRFRNTTAQSLSLAATLLERGGNLSQISEEVYGRVPLEGTRLRGKVLSNMHLESNNRIAYATIPHEQFRETETTDEDTEGFVNDLLAISTVEIAALLREPKPGKTRVSIRSRQGYDVSAVARIFGGGGHKNAAGCTFDEPVDDVVPKLIHEMKLCLG